MATNRLAKLRARRTDPAIKAAAEFREAYDSIPEDEPIKYAVGAMQPIDPAYTTQTYQEGDRIKTQLDKSLNGPWESNVEFEYQGSVTNNTHIKFYSDIDLLTLHTGFRSIEPPGRPANPYQGDVLVDLRNLRIACASAIRTAYPRVSVDDSPGRSIALEGGSLRRKIDIVISNWWDTIEYHNTGSAIQRGVKIFDSKTNTRVENRPFLHNAKIDQRDRILNGNIRKVARLLKSLKYDADTKVDISSYDITSIAYRMPEELIQCEHESELLLVDNTRLFLGSLLDDSQRRLSLRVPNEMRPIFGPEGASLDGLRQLYKEIEDLLDDINKGLHRSFRKLSEARIPY